MRAAEELADALAWSFAESGPHLIEAVVPSFPSKFPLLALDRILARPPRLILDIEVHNSPLARIASDHLPISARLDLQQVRRAQASESIAKAS